MSELPVVSGPSIGELTVAWGGVLYDLRFLGPTGGYVVELDGEWIAGPYGTLASVKAMLPGDLGRARS